MLPYPKSLSCITQLALLLTLVSLGVQQPATAASDSSDATVPESGAWQAHQYDFQYMGFTSTYTCDGLTDTMERVLKMMGAQPGFKVQPTCGGSMNRPDKLAGARLNFSSLQPTPTGGAAADAVPGVWRHVKLSPQHGTGLELGDCELVDQVRTTVLPLFSIRNLKNEVTCVPYQQSITYNLEFDVFVPASSLKAKSGGAQH